MCYFQEMYSNVKIIKSIGFWHNLLTYNQLVIIILNEILILRLINIITGRPLLYEIKALHIYTCADRVYILIVINGAEHAHAAKIIKETLRVKSIKLFGWY